MKQISLSDDSEILLPSLTVGINALRMLCLSGFAGIIISAGDLREPLLAELLKEFVTHGYSNALAKVSVRTGRVVVESPL
jgi:hypothetical protein